MKQSIVDLVEKSSRQQLTGSAGNGERGKSAPYLFNIFCEVGSLKEGQVRSIKDERKSSKLNVGQDDGKSESMKRCRSSVLSSHRETFPRCSPALCKTLSVLLFPQRATKTLIKVLLNEAVDITRV